jgi:hypothetical protein
VCAFARRGGRQNDWKFSEKESDKEILPLLIVAQFGRERGWVGERGLRFVSMSAEREKVSVCVRICLWRERERERVVWKVSGLIIPVELLLLKLLQHLCLCRSTYEGDIWQAALTLIFHYKFPNHPLRKRLKRLEPSKNFPRLQRLKCKKEKTRFNIKFWLKYVQKICKIEGFLKHNKKHTLNKMGFFNDFG